MTTSIPSFTQKPPVVIFYGVRYRLHKLDDVEFEQLYDRVLDDVNEFEAKSENWTAPEWETMKPIYQKQQARNAYNLELLELEEKRRKSLMAAANAA